MDAAVTYIDYYMGAYGKTIIIVTESRKWLTWLKEGIVKIIYDNIEVLDICQLKGVKASKNINSLELRRVDARVMPCVAIDNKNTQGACFRWEQTEEELCRLLALIEGLTSDENPGHQYLVEEGDGYIIKLSYKETLIDFNKCI